MSINGMSQIIKKLKKQILTTAYNSQEGHIASSFSCLDILWVLYDKIMNINSDNYLDDNTDKFILSKGHASLALYIVLAEKGFISKLELNTFCQLNSNLLGHPTRDIQGVIANTGSLGHGCAIAVGIALAKKIKNNSGNVYCVLGDLECCEGTVWESAMFASQHNLNNLYFIIDNNHSSDNIINMSNLANRFISFGFHIEDIIGHNHYDLEQSLSIKFDKPVCVIAHTIKGNGIKAMENEPNKWHHKSLNEQEYKAMLEELDYA